MTKPILIINTGGTFGMVASERGLVPAEQLQQRIDERVPESRNFSFDLVELTPLIDSSDLRPADWRRIAAQVVEKRDLYRGFVVIHGTDTLAYSAAALSFMLRGLGLPLVVTGSQIPLAMPESDAVTNLIDSLTLLNDLNDGVWVCFGGRVLLGSRTRKLDAQAYAAFDTPNVGGFVDLGSAATPLQLPLPQFREGAVATLFIYPGIPASLIDALSADPRVEAIILLAFGSGNLPSFASDFTDGLRRASQRGKLIVNLTQCLRGRVIQGAYATGSVLAEIGALEGFDLTPEAAFARLHYLLASCQNRQEVIAAWPHPLAGELSR